MKQLHIFRIFVLFPLIGIMGPDIATALHSSLSAIAKDHIVVDVTLLVCVVVCSVGIMYTELKQLKAA